MLRISATFSLFSWSYWDIMLYTPRGAASQVFSYQAQRSIWCRISNSGFSGEMNGNLTFNLLAVSLQPTMIVKARFELFPDPDKKRHPTMFAHAESRESDFVDVELPVFMAHTFLLWGFYKVSGYSRCHDEFAYLTNGKVVDFDRCFGRASSHHDRSCEEKPVSELHLVFVRGSPR